MDEVEWGEVVLATVLHRGPLLVGEGVPTYISLWLALLSIASLLQLFLEVLSSHLYITEHSHYTLITSKCYVSIQLHNWFLIQDVSHIRTLLVLRRKRLQILILTSLQT
jgi:hypothetical protein